MNRKRKLIKRQEAKIRQKVRNKCSSTEQLEVLDKKLGKNIGAKKEREKLLGKINNNKTKNKSKRNK
ncbi:hypothetical protein CL614_09640 [archaeon]|nr:hypothetical protein [archaeon]|tara:strand:+ start:117 stop:317 length:201 start_codon:yes stop_codon:yes gene_type:complete